MNIKKAIEKITDEWFHHEKVQFIAEEKINDELVIVIGVSEDIKRLPSSYKGFKIKIEKSGIIKAE